MKFLKSIASHAAVFMRSCFISFHKRVYNLVSRMTIEVESAHLVVHLLQRSALYGVNLRKKLWKCSQRSKRVYNLVSRMKIQVESAHLVVHLSQRSALYGVNLRKKLWKCSQRSLKEDNPLGGILFLQIQRPYRYSNVIICTDSTVEHTEDEGLGANILVLRCVRWQKLELSCRTSIREKFSQVNCSASNCLTSSSSKKKKEKKDRRRGK